jgi:hypothetical protein
MLFGLLQCGMGHSFQRDQSVNAMMPDNVGERVKRWAEEGNCRVAFLGTRPKVADFALDIVRID